MNKQFFCNTKGRSVLAKNFFLLFFGIFALIGTIVVVVGAVVLIVSSTSNIPIILPLVFLGIGAAIAIPGWSGVLYQIKKRKLRKEAIDIGYPVSGVITSIESNPYVRINNSNVIVAFVECRHPNTGAQIEVRSDYLGTYNPGYQVGDQATVYFHPTRENIKVVKLGEPSISNQAATRSLSDWL